MKQKQINDIEVSMYFIPQCMKNISISDNDKQMYIEWSSQGLHKDKIGGIPYKMDGFNALIQGKEWRGVHIGMYEDGVLEGTMPYATILQNHVECIKRKWYMFWKPKYTYIDIPIPRVVVDFIKKEMFKGIDADIIENCYQNLYGKQK